MSDGPNWFLGLAVITFLAIAFLYLWASDVIEDKFAPRRPVRRAGRGSGPSTARVLPPRDRTS